MIRARDSGHKHVGEEASDFVIMGQEGWVSDGPSTTDSNDLIDENKDPTDFLLNPVNNDELDYLIAQYGVTNLFGQTAGIGDISGFG